MKNILTKVNNKIDNIHFVRNLILALAVFLSASSIAFCYLNNYIIIYGDAESHLNIAKRVVQSLTPGFAQLGGIWLPLPHLLMVPFVYFDTLWRTGLAGSIISGIFFVISCIYLFKLVYLLTGNKLASFIAFFVFSLNPNILYMQATPMTEIPLIAFFILSTYYFFKFLLNEGDIISLILAGFFGFCASLSRYDGWFLILIEALAIIFYYIGKKGYLRVIEGKFVLFSTLSFFGVFLWLLWDFIILGDPFYFTSSPFSANSQQQGWLIRGELPAYKNIYLSFLYYAVTSASNTGIIVFIMATIGLFFYIFKERVREKLLLVLLLLVPFIFYVVTLYLGQSVIFIPELTPSTFEWRLFNVRYGLMMVPAIAFFLGYLFYKVPTWLKFMMIFLLFTQTFMFLTGFSNIITFADGKEGLSSSRRPDAERWLEQNYNGGLILLDDYARTISVIRADIPMQNVIYIGNKPYWEESLQEPEKYARWIVMQENDAVWEKINDNPYMQARLYKYFRKVYTSPNILIFERNDVR